VEFDSIQLGENIRIEIKKSRFQINDPHILSIGQFLGRAGLAAVGPSEPSGQESVKALALEEGTEEEGSEAEGSEAEGSEAEGSEAEGEAVTAT
jgi:hypothetical protein